MSDKSTIEWTDATWPVVTGCTHVSEGCDNCYAAKLTSGRLKHLPEYVGLAEHGRFNGTVRILADRLDWPLKWRRPRKIFVSDMADLFHAAVPDEFIAEVFAVMAACPQHTFQVLTKRHARMRSLLSSDDFRETAGIWGASVMRSHDSRPRIIPEETWPLPNVWTGVSVENQRWADIRIPALVDTPSAMRFLSCEPVVGPMDLTAWMPPGFARWRCGGCRRFYSGPAQEGCPGCGRDGYWCGSHTGNGRPNGQPIGWVIAGGESGGRARPAPPAWFRSIRDQCTAAEVPFLFKQWGSYRWVARTVWDEPTQCWADRGMEPERVSKTLAGRELDGRTWDEYPQQAAVSAA